jgi:hypothetical protein
MYAFLNEWWEVAMAERRGMSERATCVPVERVLKTDSARPIDCRDRRKTAHFVLMEEWITH